MLKPLRPEGAFPLPRACNAAAPPTSVRSATYSLNWAPAG